jgi:hypothetical protein
MISNQGKLIVTKRETAHSIRFIGYAATVAHGIAKPREDAIAEVLRQIQDSRRIRL